jgi:outer membrane receptor protein involved in Fe transport
MPHVDKDPLFSAGRIVMHASRGAATALMSLVFAIGSATSTFAQGDAAIRGVVTARPDGSAVADAVVELQGNALRQIERTTTAADGRFTFSRLVPGDYVVTVAHGSFQEKRLRLSLRPREVFSAEAVLDLRRVEEAVDVAVAAPPSVHSPSSTLLTSSRLENLPFAQRTNLPDAIVTVAPGMIRGHDDFVHIRGHEVALNPTINGVQFWENAHAVFSPGLGVGYIESMNVMTGGFPAEYGNRFGGILDIVTKSGYTLGNRGSIALGVGSAQRHSAEMEFGGRRGRLGYYINATGFMSDRFLSPPSPRSIHNSGGGVRSFGRVDVRASESNQLKLVMMGDGVNFDLPMDERDELLRADFRNAQRARSESLILSWDHVRSSETVVGTSSYQRRSTARQFAQSIDPYGAQTDADRRVDTVGVKSDLTHLRGLHTLKTGIDAVFLRPKEEFSYLSQPWIDFTHLPAINESHVHFRGPNLGAGVPRPVVFEDERNGWQASLYVQDKLQLTSAFTLDAGLRIDRYRLAISETHVSPRLNAAYRLPLETVLFASYNHFFVPPAIDNVLASSAGLTSFLSEIGRPLPPVQAIKEDQFEVGVRQPVAGLIDVGVTSYYRASDNPPHTTLFPDSRFYTYAAFDKGKAYGLEIKADVPNVADLGLSAYLNYAVGRVWFYNPIIAGFTTEAAHLTETDRFLAPMDQTHTLTSGLTYRHSPTRIWGTVVWEYGSGTPGGHGSDDHEDEDGDVHEHASGPGLCGSRCPSHFTQNLSLGWNAMSTGGQPRMTFQFDIENVSNRVYLLSKESTMVQGQYSIPRLFSASVRWRF